LGYECDTSTGWMLNGYMGANDDGVDVKRVRTGCVSVGKGWIRGQARGVSRGPCWKLTS